MLFWVNILFWPTTLYVGLCLVFYFGQDPFFFRPERLAKSFKYQYPFPITELNFDMEDGGMVNALHFRVPNSKYTEDRIVLYGRSLGSGPGGFLEPTSDAFHGLPVLFFFVPHFTFRFFASHSVAVALPDLYRPVYQKCTLPGSYYRRCKRPAYSVQPKRDAQSTDS